MAIRFKITHKGSPVTIALKPEQVLRHHQFSPTEEGWESRSCDWRLDHDQEGALIHYEIISDGVDCDGRLTRCTSMDARVESVDDDGWPNWITTNSSQRDYAAEAMGY